VKVAYADPPYVGQAKKHYNEDEVNHELLMLQLEEYDGWALSCSSPSLRYLLPFASPETRVMAWVKPFAIYKPNVNPAYAWEPVLVKPARKWGRDRETTRDWVSTNITLQRGLVGVKPDAFSYWLFEVLGMVPEDEFIDLFPGTRAVAKAWDTWKASPKLMPMALRRAQERLKECEHNAY